MGKYRQQKDNIMDMQHKQTDDSLGLEKNIELKVVKPASILGRIFRIGMLVVMPIGLLAGGLAYKTILDASTPQIIPEKAIEKSTTVEVFEAVFADIRPTIEIYGQTVAGKQLNLRTNVSGEVVQVSANFKSGALVNAGELLFSIDPFTYEGALLTAKSRYDDTLTNIEELKLRSKSENIGLDTARDQLVAAEKDHVRGINLRQQGTITSKALDDKALVVTQRKQSVDLAENNLQAQVSQMKRLETSLKTIQYSIDKAQRDLDNTKIFAPFDAYVQNASLQIGQLASTNEQIAALIDRSKMDIVFTLSDSLYGRILAQDGTLIGRQVKLIWQAGSTVEQFTATIDRVAAQITASSGGIELFAQINDLENVATLRVGSFMTVQIPDRLFKNVLKVPEHVIYDGDTLYILEKSAVEIENEETENISTETLFETRLKAEKIKTVGYDGKFVLVTNLAADGLKASDVILKTKLSTAGDGVLVLTRTEAEAQRVERLKKSAEAKLEKDAEKADEAIAKAGE